MPLAGEMGQVALGPGPAPGGSPKRPPGRTSRAEGGFLRLFRPFSRLLAALDAIRSELRGVSVELSELSATQKALGPSIERLDKLELSRHHFEAMCEGLLQKAEGKHRAANNAEARERANRRSYEHLIDPLAEAGVEEATAGPVRDHDAPPGEAERLQAMRLDVAPTNKTLAQRAKFGVR